MVVNAEDHLDVATRLVQMRLDAELSQAELAQRLGVSKPHVSKIENGWERASERLLRRYAEVFGFDAEQFLLDVGRRPMQALESLRVAEERIRALTAERDHFSERVEWLQAELERIKWCDDGCADCRRAAATALERTQ